MEVEKSVLRHLIKKDSLEFETTEVLMIQTEMDLWRHSIPQILV
jgi:hypothetical protein